MNPPTSFRLSKKNRLFFLLSGIFLTNAIIAEIIGVKIFSGEGIFGLSPVQWHPLPGVTLGFTYSAGVVIWPVVFIISDIINEYFGPKGVRRISFTAAALIAYGFIVIYLTTLLPPAAFWLDVNKTPDVGADFNINVAFSKIFRQGLGIILGSLTAFLVGQLLDAFIFHRLRRITQNRKVWLRATGSTLVSQVVDSFLVLYIAFYVFGNWTMAQVLEVGLNNYVYKFVVAILLTPLIYLAHFVIDRYLGEEKAEEITRQAAAG